MSTFAGLNKGAINNLSFLIRIMGRLYLILVERKKAFSLTSADKLSIQTA